MWNSVIHCFTCRLRTRKPGFKHNSSHDVSQRFAPPIWAYILNCKMKGLGHLWQSALGHILQQVSSKDHGLLSPINLKFQFLSIMLYSVVFILTKYNRNLPFLSFLSVQFSDTNYIHYVVQPSTYLFPKIFNTPHRIFPFHFDVYTHTHTSWKKIHVGSRITGNLKFLLYT